MHKPEAKLRTLWSTEAKGAREKTIFTWYHISEMLAIWQAADTRALHKPMHNLEQGSKTGNSFLPVSDACVPRPQS